MEKLLGAYIYIFSPTINIDNATWGPVKHYIEHDLKVNPKREQIYFEDWDESKLHDIVEEQHKIVEMMKSKKDNDKMYQIAIIVDDHADNPQLRNSKAISNLFTKGRHRYISCVITSQKYNLLNPVLRVNATELYVFRLRNYVELQAILEELGALVKDKKTLLHIYITCAQKRPIHLCTLI